LLHNHDGRRLQGLSGHFFKQAGWQSASKFFGGKLLRQARFQRTSNTSLPEPIPKGIVCGVWLGLCKDLEIKAP
jgi:hypothetical protein